MKGQTVLSSKVKNGTKIKPFIGYCLWKMLGKLREKCSCCACAHKACAHSSHFFIRLQKVANFFFQAPFTNQPQTKRYFFCWKLRQMECSCCARAHRACPRACCVGCAPVVWKKILQKWWNIHLKIHFYNKSIPKKLAKTFKAAVARALKKRALFGIHWTKTTT